MDLSKEAEEVAGSTTSAASRAEIAAGTASAGAAADTPVRSGRTTPSAASVTGPTRAGVAAGVGVPAGPARPDAVRLADSAAFSPWWQLYGHWSSMVHQQGRGTKLASVIRKIQASLRPGTASTNTSHAHLPHTAHLKLLLRLIYNTPFSCEKRVRFQFKYIDLLASLVVPLAYQC